MTIDATDNGSGQERPSKSPTAFRTISEVADELGVQPHVLRFWESKFPQVRPLKRAGGRRYYRPDDVAALRLIKSLLHEQGYTIKGAQKVLRGRRRGSADVEPTPTPDPGTGEDAFRRALSGLARDLRRAAQALRRTLGS